MADEKDPIEPQEPTEPQEPQEPKQPAEPAEPQDKGIDPHKYQRDIEKRDSRIKELEAQIEEAAKTAEAKKELEDQLNAFKAEMADKDLTYELERAGCRNPKAAKALLDDYEGDIAKLRESEPYLFEEKQQKGTTGLKPAGAGGDSEARRAAARKAAGLK